MLEAQVLKQKLENNIERDRLQSLIAKMESHVSQQRKQIEQDRWDVQQHTAKLTAQQNAFEEERTSTLLKLETERERLEQAKEKFLSEQQDILSRCYEERRSVASEKASLSVLQQKALEREKRDKQYGLQVSTPTIIITVQPKLFKNRHCNVSSSTVYTKLMYVCHVTFQKVFVYY